MFQLYDDFISCDTNLQPYSFEVERHTYVENLHAEVKKGCFHMKSIGNRYILNTPEFSTCRFSVDFKMNCLDVFDPQFTIFFQYDKKRRRGKGVRIHYGLSGVLQVSLVEDVGNRLTELLELTAENFLLEEMKECPLEVVIDEHSVSCSVGKARFVFACENKAGLLAVERDNFIGELILQNLRFTSEDTFETYNILQPTTVQIPLVNGGDIPYEVTWQLDRIGNQYFMQCTLDGGTRSRKLNREDRRGQFGVEIDRMTTPYVGIRRGSFEEVYNIANGEICFVDPNIIWECQKGFFGDTKLPIHRWFLVNEDMFDQGIADRGLELIFGYEKLACKGYPSQQGDHEFRYDTAGNLLYSGVALDGKDIYQVLSPFDKFAMSLIPEECYHREEVEEHIKYNHYFERSEAIQFTLVMETTLDDMYIGMEASVMNVYETETLAACKPEISADAAEASETMKKPGHANKGYRTIKAAVRFDSLDTGVYKIVFDVLYGGKLYHQVIHTFEVFDKDTDESPVLKSGLPFVFSMANEQKWLMRNAFDVWDPTHSCDYVHYIACATDTPIEAETRKSWELLKAFKRKWFVWLAPRTCNDYLDEKHLEAVRNADYLFYGKPQIGACARSQHTQFPLRSDHWTFATTKSKFQQGLLHDFLSQNPEAAKVVGWDMEKGAFCEGQEFSYEHYERLMSHFRDEWIGYVNSYVLELLEAQNRELEEINPGVKRAIYGPFSVYTTPTLSYRTLPAYGLPTDKRLRDVVFNGFTAFEDYPFSCAYHTYRGAFSLMSILLHCPDAVIYPEQYCGGRGGSPDGAVKFAHGPMGAYKVEPYQNATHSFEYVFNTPYRLGDGYHYWNTYGFHRRSHSPQMLNSLVRDWKYVIANKPEKPMKSMAFIAEYDESDTVFDVVVNDQGDRLYAFNNQSELAAGFLHECSREGGIPNGFALKFDTLSSMTADECDLIVIPSLKHADKACVTQLRRLYEQGVNLIAVSDVTGLEDLFGVCEEEKACTVNSLKYQGETENIYEAEAVFRYQPCGSEVLLWAENEMPAVLCTQRTALINTSILNLGCEKKGQRENRPVSYCVIGRLIRKALTDVLCNLSSPLAVGENVGVTLFHTKDGRKELLAINYTPFDNIEHGVEQAVIKFNMDGLRDVVSDRELFVGKKNGVVKEIRFEMKPYESAFMELVF